MRAAEPLREPRARSDNRTVVRQPGFGSIRSSPSGRSVPHSADPIGTSFALVPHRRRGSPQDAGRTAPAGNAARVRLPQACARCSVTSPPPPARRQQVALDVIRAVGPLQVAPQCPAPASTSYGPATAPLSPPAPLVAATKPDLCVWAVAICMNYHHGGDARILQKGRGHFDFRPGTWLNDTVAILKLPLDRMNPRESDLPEHNASMALSRCFAGSNGDPPALPRSAGSCGPPATPPAPPAP